ncbi:hypothetical protein L9F63_023046, partial [Diploptera punctata]
PKISNVLREVQVPVWRNDDCSRRYSRPFNSSIICAGEEIGKKNSFAGDSGGPLMIMYDGRWIQIGVASDAPDTETPFFPGLYVRVTDYMDWIEEKILE